MSTKDCGHSAPCGCEDQPLMGPPPCEQGTPNCPDPDPCPETFRAQCVVWTNEDLVCDSTVIATAGDRLPIILERMVALFCGGGGDPALASVALINPDTNGLIIGITDRIIGVDRNNCHEAITFTPVGGPAGLLFDYTDETGTLVTGAAGVVMAISQSSVRFDMDVSGVAPGTYDFTLEATACGSTLIANVHFTV